MFIEKLSDTDILVLSELVLNKVVPDISKLQDFALTTKIKRDAESVNVCFTYDKRKKVITLTDYSVKVGCALKPKQIKELDNMCAKFLYQKFSDWYLDNYKNNQIRKLNKEISKRQEQNSIDVKFLTK